MTNMEYGLAVAIVVVGFVVGRTASAGGAIEIAGNSLVIIVVAAVMAVRHQIDKKRNPSKWIDPKATFLEEPPSYTPPSWAAPASNNSTSQAQEVAEPAGTAAVPNNEPTAPALAPAPVASRARRPQPQKPVPAKAKLANRKRVAKPAPVPPPAPVPLVVMSRAGKSVRISYNSREPVPFENDQFKGHVLFLIRATPVDPYWKETLEGRKRKFWVQVQGTFKKVPKGTLYMGGEVPAPMALGIITRSLCKILLSVVKRLVVGLHYAFGDKTGIEMPHMCFPLWKAADRLVITPPGADPPKMGTDFPETAGKKIYNVVYVGSAKLCVVYY